MNSNNNEGSNQSIGNTGPQSNVGTPLPQRQVSIQPSQANQLVQALKNEVSLAKAAGNDTAKAQQHYAKAESIKQVLLNYQAQQRARMAQQQQQQQQQQQGRTPTESAGTLGNAAGNNQVRNRPVGPQSNPSAQAGISQSQGMQSSPGYTGGSTSPAPSIGNIASVEKFNQAKAHLAELERKIQQLQNSKKSYNLNQEQMSSVDNQLAELRNKYTQYQKYAIYIKAQLVDQAKSTASPPVGVASTPATSGNPQDQRLKLQRTGSTPPQSIDSPNISGKLPNAAQDKSSIPAKRSASPPAGTSSNTPSKSTQSPQFNLSGITKPSVPSIPISSNINVKPPTAVTLKETGNNNRATLSSGVANGMSPILGTPAIVKLPTYELASGGAGGPIPDNGGRVLTKRKLSDLVNTIGADEGDGKTVIDGDVEELLLDLADEFISSVTGFACRLAKHRKVDSIDVRDVQLHLERNWNIKIPGYAMDEIRSTRRWQPNNSYNQKLSGIEISKSVNGNIN